jgi:hypothetical protein
MLDRLVISAVQPQYVSAADKRAVRGETGRRRCRGTLAGLSRRRRHIGAMPTFTLAGVVYDYVTPKLEGDPEDVHSWDYGKWPKG